MLGALICLFTHPKFRLYPFENVPLNRDVFLIEEKWLKRYEASWVKFFNKVGEQKIVGYISCAAIRRIDEHALELSWYPNIHDRFHEVRITLPRSEFICCVDVYDYDEKPHIFVKNAWLNDLHLRPYSAFALVDAIGVKRALAAQTLNEEKLRKLRRRIDRLAKRSPRVSFISFADTLLLKTNWSVGTFDSNVRYTYKPEALVKLLPELSRIYESVLGLKTYAVLTQGLNYYYDKRLLHISRSRNHVCLNSLGLLFAQLLAIDSAVREAIRAGTHPPTDLYMDDQFYQSLRFRYGFDKHSQPSAAYTALLSGVTSKYYYCAMETVLSNLDANRSIRRRVSRRPTAGSKRRRR